MVWEQPGRNDVIMQPLEVFISESTHTVLQEQAEYLNASDLCRSLDKRYCDAVVVHTQGSETGATLHRRGCAGLHYVTIPVPPFMSLSNAH